MSSSPQQKREIQYEEEVIVPDNQEDFEESIKE
jgi:hypothetical protein